MQSEKAANLISLLPSEWELPQAIRRRLGQQAGRQRCMSAENHLLLVLHEPPTGSEISFTGRFFCANPTAVGVQALSETPSTRLISILMSSMICWIVWKRKKSLLELQMNISVSSMS